MEINALFSFYFIMKEGYYFNAANCFASSIFHTKQSTVEVKKQVFKEVIHL